VPPAQIKTEAFVSPGVPGAAGSSAPMESAAPVGLDAEPSIVTFSTSSKTAELAAGATILEAAEDAGIAIPFECRSGICGQCKTRLVSGMVAMDAEDALSAKEKSSGL